MLQLCVLIAVITVFQSIDLRGADLRIARDTIEEVIKGGDVMDEIAESGEANVEGALEEIAVHLAHYKRHPLNINSASKKELERSGLFTEFQIESLLKHIGRTGAVLSFAELSLLYGFN